MWDRVTWEEWGVGCDCGEEGKRFDISLCLQGGTAGSISRTVVAPWERAKILQQTEAILGGNEARGQKKVGLNETLVRIWREDGIKGLFRGNLSNVYRVYPYMAIHFALFERFKAWRRNEGKKVGTFERFWGGGLCGMAAMTATYPLDVVRGRISTQKEGKTARVYKGVGDAIFSIAKEEGVVKGLWRGASVSVIGIFPYLGTQMAAYAFVRDHLVTALGVASTNDLPTLATLGAGAVAGAAGQTVAYPFDLLRRRIQVASFSTAANAQEEAAIYQGSMLRAFRHIVQVEGIRGLYRGLFANYMKIAPSMAVNFLVYERCRQLFGLKASQ